MTLFMIIRHGANDLLDNHILAGRAPGVHLNGRGRRQAAALADCLAAWPIEAIYSSPLERSLETAEPIARQQGRTAQVLPAINEVDFGQWTGRCFDDFGDDPQWRAFNQSRSSTRIPSGEMGLEVQVRMIGAVEGLLGMHNQGMIALVSHGDPIRALVAHCLCMPLDAIARFEISPASVSVVDFACRHAPRVLCLNSKGQDLPL
jgi:probable phosphoglycerate mutase